MTVTELINRLDSPEAGSLFEKLYGKEGTEAARGRYRALLEGMASGFPGAGKDIRIFTAAGRTELGGNHTDHNRGKVLAASIQLDSVAVAAPREDKTVIFRSTGYPDVVVDLTDLSKREAEINTTEALVRGIAAEFAARGTGVRGFTANADSTVLTGSGLSSSAAVEVLLGRIFDSLYGGGKRSALEIAQIGQKAENNYFGKPSGLMDQVACASGGAVAIDFADPLDPKVRRINFDLGAAGYALCVVDTKGSHADLTPDYAAVPTEMKAVAGFFGKSVLREVSPEEVLSRIPELRKAAGDRAVLRAIHFFNENNRVDAMERALETIDNAAGNAEKHQALETYLSLVNESGNSSWELLQNVYSPKNPGEQGISLALALTRNFLDSGAAPGSPHPGACRVHGGGFAGTIQAYIPLERLNDYRAELENVFGTGSVTELRIRPVGAEELTFG
ncbi:galactokinase [Breznakiella homolactica]|uniref:Galactokinase n=1 Tax=Breznakiella homolactica TaxID=2798577 RepID=A0A7T8BAQ2_9SPIR|nr:galactokinase family protein [Breznakiella homolactica]QQO09722.1 galactokinase [Breznakiella homolactica]